MYSTVIEGLKYASSHEWYVHRNSHPLFFRSELSPFVLFGNTFFCFLSLSSVFLSLCNISYAHRVNESEGDEFGRRKREREREREKRANARTVHSSSR